MRSLTLILCFGFILSIAGQKVLQLPQVDMNSFEQKTVTVDLDHFNEEETRTFDLRYWINYDHVSEDSNLAFLYICGEAACNSPNERSFHYQVAASLNAVIMSLEHRYYGDSQPFSNEEGGWATENLHWLNSTQTLADIAQFIDKMNLEFAQGSQKKTQWIVCGGSYAGALSAWFRSLYPDHAVISWSSSGVIHAIRDFYDFDLDIYQATVKSGDFCPETIQGIVKYIDDVFADQEIGESLEEYAEIQQLFESEGMRNDEFMFFLADIFTIGVQYGGRTALCDFMQEVKELEKLDQVRKLSEYVANVGVATWMYDYRSLQDTEVTTYGNYRQWTYQYCTEFAFYQIPNPDHPMRSYLIDDPFWDAYCSRVFGTYIVPQVDVTNQIYGGMEIKGSKIVFANAIEDPWQYAGMREIYDPATQSGMTAVLIDCEDCGHCADLGTPRDSDSQALIDARELIYNQILQWLAEGETAHELRESLFLQ